MKINNLDELEFGLAIIKKQAQELLKYGACLLDVRKFIKPRSNEQNSYYFLFNKWVADCLNKAGCTYGEYELPYTVDLVHDINKKVFGYSTTTKMSVGEFCDYITQVSAFWIEKTKGELEIPELPDAYLERKGYTREYGRV